MQKTIQLTANNQKFSINVEMSFSDISTEQLKKWAFADRIIAMQRVLRECSTETLQKFERDGYTVHALAAGTKPQTTEEILAAVKAALAALPEAERQAALEKLI